MAVNLNTVYPANSDVDAAYPVGKARNESYDGAKDWFPLEATWVNELLGFFGALLNEKGWAADGNPEKIVTSQYLAAIKTMSRSLSYIVNGYADLAYGRLGMGSESIGKIEMRAGVGDPNPRLITYAANTKSNVHTVSAQNGYLKYADNPGTDHSEYSVLFPIDVSDIAFVSGTPSYILVTPGVLTGLAYGTVKSSVLIMKNTSNCLTFPLIADYISSGGSLSMAEAHCVVRTGITYNPAGYTEFYLRLVIEPSTIS